MNTPVATPPSTPAVLTSDELLLQAPLWLLFA